MTDKALGKVVQTPQRCSQQAGSDDRTASLPAVGSSQTDRLQWVVNKHSISATAAIHKPIASRPHTP
jgi:hypothetical protein